MTWLALLLLAFVVARAGMTRAAERRAWNGGVSPTGKRWVRLDCDSSGARGYGDGDGNYVWVSWGVDRG